MSKNTTAVEQVRTLMAALGRTTSVNDSFRNGQLVGQYFNTESADSQDIANNTTESLRTEIELAAKESGLDFESADYDRAALAGLLSADPKAAHAQALSFKKDDSMGLINSRVANSSVTRAFSGESYNEADIDIFQRAGIVMSLMASQQTDFTKAFYRPISIDPREAGIITPVTVSMIYNDYKHATDGSLAITGRKLVVRGFVNPKILHNDLNKIVPVYRATGNRSNVKHFVDESQFKPVADDLGGGVTVMTSYLKTDMEQNLIGISQTNQSLTNGLANSTFTISDVIRLDSLIIGFGDTSYVVSTKGIPGWVFEPPIQGGTRRTQLNLDTNSVVIKAGSLTSLGELPTGEAAILADYNLRIEFYVNGYVELSHGKSKVTKSSVVLHAATTKDGKPVTEDEFTKLAEIIAKGTVDGFKLDANRENLNLANNGILTESVTHRLLVTVPYREAVSNVSTTYDNAFDFDAALANLITIHRMKSDGEGVKALHDWFSLLDDYRAVIDDQGNAPEIDCVGSRAGIIPTSYAFPVDAQDLVDGIRSADRFEDIKAALMGYIHTIAMDLIVNSEFKSVAKAFGASEGFKPELIIGTDPIIASYLTPKFDEVEHQEYTIKVVSSDNDTMTGLIYIALTDKAENTTGNTLSPLVWGNYASGPDMVSNLNKSVDGTTSRFVTSTPRYLHINNVPVMGKVIVSNVQKLALKLSMNVNATIEKVEADAGTEGENDTETP